MEIKRALISVADKTGVVELARELAGLGVELLSTGGTAMTLVQAGLKVTKVSEVTGHPEILEGRVKTLHPKIHGGILARRDLTGHMEELLELGIGPIDLVAVNLYPFNKATAAQDCTLETALENIDIGGPAMLRAAAKNFPAVVPLCRARDYPLVLAELKGAGMVTQELRQKLAVAAFAHTSAYDSAICRWLEPTAFPETLTLSLARGPELRYGENPHQAGAIYRWPGQCGLAWAEPLQGKQLSYNNYNDASAALALVAEFSEPAAVAVKHAVPCGAATGETLAQAFIRARQSDPVSIFGGIVACNREVDGDTAKELKEVFLEVVIAPAFSQEARAILATKTNLRLLECPIIPEQGSQYRSVSGGLLVQEADLGQEDWQVSGSVLPPAELVDQAKVAWLVAKHARSNAIVVVREGATLGIGSGCTSRIGAARMALAAAGEQARGAVLASDGFIPFPDVVEEAATAGIALIVQPGGSKGDEKVLTAANALGIAMIFTGSRHFRH